MTGARLEWRAEKTEQLAAIYRERALRMLAWADAADRHAANLRQERQRRRLHLVEDKDRPITEACAESPSGTAARDPSAASVPPLPSAASCAASFPAETDNCPASSIT